MNLLAVLREEKESRRKGDLYHQTQIKLTYNTNRIEGSKLSVAHDITPLIIEDDHKYFYYRGLSEYPKVKGYLIDTCLSAQDTYNEMIKYF